jgi:hypothetical protein
MKRLTTRVALIAALGLSLLATVAQPSNPALAFSQAPVEVQAVCSADARATWIGESTRGDLFTMQGCGENGAAAFLVEKAGTASRVLAAVTGELTWTVTPQRSYPTLTVREVLSTEQTQITEWRWDGSHYVQTSKELAYAIDNETCQGTHGCRAAAERALQQKRVNHAVRIFEVVHGVSWI